MKYLLSKGMLMFQEKTFKWLGDKYGLPHTDILDFEQAKEIYKAARKDGIAQDHWVNCFRKLKLKTNLNEINI